MGAPAGMRALWAAAREGRTPGQGSDVPPARLWVFAVGWALVAAQVLARHAGFLYGERWFAAHLAIGWAVQAALLAAVWPGGLRRAIDRRTVAVIGSGAACLLAFWYFGRVDTWQEVVEARAPASGWLRPVWGFAWFSLSALLFRLAVPAAIALLAGWRADEFGWTAGRGRAWPIYAALYALVLPAVVWASASPAFQATYPAARALIADRRIDAVDFAAYQALYALVFVSGECFWRGWLCLGIERRLGAHAILVMIVPYVCAHYGKPMPETLGAIAAGTVLGWLALHHRSVWAGVALHYGVALTMDVAAMARAGIALG